MVVVARVSLASDTFELGGVLDTEESAEIDLARFVPLDPEPIPYLVVETADPEAFETELQDDARVDSLTREHEHAGKTLYHVDWAKDHDGFLDCLGAHDVLIERGRGRSDEWTFRLWASDLDTLRTFHADCRDRNHPLEVEWISGGDLSSDRSETVPVAGGRTDEPDVSWPRRRTDPSVRIGRDFASEPLEGSTPFRDIVENLDEVVWMTDPETEELLYVNPAYERVWGYPCDTLYEEPRAFLDAIHPDDVDRVRAALESQPTGEYDEEYRIERPDGSIRWIRDRAVPIRNDAGEVYRVAGIAEDITERKAREQILTELYDTTRSLLQGDSPEDVAERAVHIAADILQLRLVCIYLEDATGVLRPAAWTDDVEEVIGKLPTFTANESLAWNAFVDDETRVFDDVRTEAGAYNRDTPIRSELIVPIGEFGVLLAGDTESSVFDETDVELAKLLAINAETALENVEYEQHLERQNEQLVDLSRLNTTIRGINQAIVEAATREEIESKVCRHLVEADSYAAAWIGEYRTDREIEIRSVAGIGDGYFEGDTIPVVDDTPLDTLVGTAHDTGAVYIMQDLDEVSAADPLHERLLDRGCCAAATVPLVAGKAQYGVLTVYTTCPVTFDPEEITILRELGETIGRAIRAAETRQTLVTETAVRLEFEIRDTTSFFISVSEELECRLELVGLVPLSEDHLLYYITMEGASPDAFLERAAAWPSIETSRLLTETDDGGVLELGVTGMSAFLVLLDYGATISSASADRGVGRITAEISPETDARTMLNGLRTLCPSATLLRKRNVDRPVRTVQQFRELFTDQLTDRQLNALQAAYFAGYFEWPRRSTAEDIAEPMDVSSSTFHFHLRHALEKLLVAFFEASGPEPRE